MISNSNDHIDNNDRKGIFLPIIFFSLILAIYVGIDILRTEGIILGKDEYTLNYVLDGDTIDVSQYGKSFRVRYIGINAPEIDHPPKTKDCYGYESKEYNEKLLKGVKKLTLIKDVTDKDIYGRLLRYVYVGNEFINQELVRNGYAYTLNIPPNSKYKDVFTNAAVEARESNLGVWAYCAYEDKRAN